MKFYRKIMSMCNGPNLDVIYKSLTDKELNNTIK